MGILPRPLLIAFLLLLPALCAYAQQDRRLNDDQSTRLQENPMIAVDSSGALLVAWSDERNGTTNPQIYITRSTDGGFTWSPNVRVTSQQARPAGGMEMGPNIATGPGGGVYINWADIRRPPAWSRVDVCVARSTDGGITFSGDPRINNDSMKSQHQPAIATGADGTVYSVWHGFPAHGEPLVTPVFIARSTDMGSTFEPQRRVDHYAGSPDPREVGSCNCCRPWVFTDGAANVYVAFRIDSAKIRDIFLSRSTDRGETWSAAVRVSRGMWNYDACPSSGPTGVGRSDTLLVTWMDQRSALEAPSVYLARSTDGGRTFDHEIRIDSSANFPTVALDRQGRVFVMWQRTNDLGNVYCAVSSDGGTTFSSPRQVNNTKPKDQNSHAACVAAPNGQVYGVWVDRRRDIGDINFSNLTELMESSSSAPGIEESRAADLSIHPNPLLSGGELEVEIAGRPLTATIIDGVGRTVRRLDPALERQHVIIEESGVFFVVADFGFARRVSPLIVVR